MGLLIAIGLDTGHWLFILSNVQGKVKCSRWGNRDYLHKYFRKSNAFALVFADVRIPTLIPEDFLRLFL